MGEKVKYINKASYREVKELDNTALNVADYARKRGWESTSTLYNHVREVIAGRKTWAAIGFEVIRYKGFNYVLPL